MKNLFIICIVLSTQALASYQFSLATSYITRKANVEVGSEVVSEETRQPMEIKFGTVLSNKVYLGGIYNIGTRTVKTTNNENTEKLTAYGATLGYDAGGWLVHLSYYLSAELDLGTDNNRKYIEGSGFQLDIGLKFKAWSIYVVPQIAYSSLSYKTRDTNGTEVDVDSSDFGGIIPQVAFMYEF
jgi:hypothetical protein